MSRAELTILGGGPAGLGVAWYANRAAIPFALYEKADAVGGMCRTLQAGQHSYDLGAHRLHDRVAEITADLRDLLGPALQPVSAPSKIYDEGQFIDFPPTPLNLLASSGPRRLARIVVELIRARFNRAPDRTFRDFAVRNFGETLARRYLIDYSEKLWGLPAAELAPDVSTRRLSGMSLWTLLRELVTPGVSGDHIDGAFLYPRAGYGSICQAIAETLPADSIVTGRGVSEMVCSGNRITELVLEGGERVKPSGQVVSTLPLTLLVRILGAAVPDAVHTAAAQLRFRALRLFFLRLSRASVSSNATLYLPDPALCITRVHEPRNRSVAMAPLGETSLVVEVPCFSGDALCDAPDEVLAERVIREVADTSLIDPGEVVEWRHHFLPAAYPVYSMGYERAVETVFGGLESIENLTPLGRSGVFSYSHLHDQLSTAKTFVAERAASAGEGLGE